MIDLPWEAKKTVATNLDPVGQPAGTPVPPAVDGVTPDGTTPPPATDAIGAAAVPVEATEDKPADSGAPEDVFDSIDNNQEPAPVAEVPVEESPGGTFATAEEVAEPVDTSKSASELPPATPPPAPITLPVAPIVGITPPSAPTTPEPITTAEENVAPAGDVSVESLAPTLEGKVVPATNNEEVSADTPFGAATTDGSEQETEGINNMFKQQEKSEISDDAGGLPGAALANRATDIPPTDSAQQASSGNAGTPDETVYTAKEEPPAFGAAPEAPQVEIPISSTEPPMGSKTPTAIPTNIAPVFPPAEPAASVEEKPEDEDNDQTLPPAPPTPPTATPPASGQGWQ